MATNEPAGIVVENDPIVSVTSSVSGAMPLLAEPTVKSALRSAPVATATDWAISVTPASIVLAFGFSFVVGTSFGVYPAQRASRPSSHGAWSDGPCGHAVLLS